MAGHIICFVSFRFVSFRFVSICFVSFRSVSFRFDLFRFVSICFVSFRFVSVSFRTLQGPLNLAFNIIALSPLISTKFDEDAVNNWRDTRTDTRIHALTDLQQPQRRMLMYNIFDLQSSTYDIWSRSFSFVWFKIYLKVRWVTRTVWPKTIYL